MQISLIKSLIL